MGKGVFSGYFARFYPRIVWSQKTIFWLLKKMWNENVAKKSFLVVAPNSFEKKFGKIFEKKIESTSKKSTV